MTAITPQQVLAVADTELRSRVAAHVELAAAALYDGALLEQEAAALNGIFASAGLEPVPITAHARNAETGAYLHASKQWEYLFGLAALRELLLGKSRILDAGGGRGALAWHLAALGATVEVIDRDYSGDDGGDTGIERRYMQTGTASLKFRHGSIHNLPVPDAGFDAIICISVIAHLREQKLALAELLRVLRPGGLLVLTFDFASAAAQFEDDHRAMIFSPARLREFLEPVCAQAQPFSEDAIAASAARLTADGVAGVPAPMTVGGIVLRKS